MSRLLTSEEGLPSFELGDLASFMGPYGYRLTGEVVRVYNSRDDYHVEVRGQRYSVNRQSDEMQRATVEHVREALQTVTTGWTDADRAAQSRRIYGEDAVCADCSRGGDGPPCCLPGCQG